jgi:hypothetical protein
MAETVSRRDILLASAALAAVPAVGWSQRASAAQGAAALPAPAIDASWRPLFLSRPQGEAVAALAETILPRTATPGAIDARVHEWIDLDLSVAAAADQQRFLDGLAWVQARSRRLHGVEVSEATPEQLSGLLAEISDERSGDAGGADGDDDLEVGRSFFGDLKRRTIFGYFTSEVGRVQGLGLPEAVTMETFRGCTHRDGSPP